MDRMRRGSHHVRCHLDACSSGLAPATPAVYFRPAIRFVARMTRQSRQN